MLGLASKSKVLSDLSRGNPAALIRRSERRRARSSHSVISSSARKPRQSAEEFAASYVPQRDRAPNGLAIVRCAVTRDGVRCVRPKHCRDLCATHYGTWRYHQRRGNGDRWRSHIAVPFTDELPCLVPACPSPSYNACGLCGSHSRLWTRDNGTAPTSATAWAPYLAAHQFSLVPLAEPVRRDVLYALQQVDRWARVLGPAPIRTLVRDHTGATTLLSDEPRPLSAPRAAAYRRTLEELRIALRAGFEEFCGRPARGEDVLELRSMGLRAVNAWHPHPRPNRRPHHLGPGPRPLPE